MDKFVNDIKVLYEIKMSILVFIQQENGSINRLSKEAISGANN